VESSKLFKKRKSSPSLERSMKLMGLGGEHQEVKLGEKGENHKRVKSDVPDASQ